MIIIHYFQRRGDKYGNHWYLSFTQNSWRCQYSPCNLLPNAVVEHDMEFNFIALIEKGQDWLDACIFFQILVHTLEVQMFSMIIYLLYWLYDGRENCNDPGLLILRSKRQSSTCALCLWKVMSDKFSVWSTPKLEWSCVE